MNGPRQTSDGPHWPQSDTDPTSQNTARGEVRSSAEVTGGQQWQTPHFQTDCSLDGPRLQ